MLNFWIPVPKNFGYFPVERSWYVLASPILLKMNVLYCVFWQSTEQTAKHKATTKFGRDIF